MQQKPCQNAEIPMFPAFSGFFGSAKTLKSGRKRRKQATKMSDRPASL
jgi:hypothetical protein